jgi:hypothetical protein
VRRDLSTSDDTRERTPDHRTGQSLDFRGEHIMAKLLINDLADNVELDREAMAAIVGGARIGARLSSAAPLVPTSTRVVEYPPGFPAAHQTIVKVAATRNTRRS